MEAAEGGRRPRHVEGAVRSSPSRHGVQLSAPSANGTVRCRPLVGTAARARTRARRRAGATRSGVRRLQVGRGASRAPSSSKVTKSAGPSPAYAAQWCAPKPTGRCSTRSTSASQARRTSARTSASVDAGRRLTHGGRRCAEPVEGALRRWVADQLEHGGGRLVGTVGGVDGEVAVAVGEDQALLVRAVPGSRSPRAFSRRRSSAGSQVTWTSSTSSPSLSRSRSSSRHGSLRTWSPSTSQPHGGGADERPVVGGAGAVEDVLPLPVGELGVGPGPDLVEQIHREHEPRRAQPTDDGLRERRLARARRSVEEDEPAGRHASDRSDMPTPMRAVVSLRQVSRRPLPGLLNQRAG